MAIMRDQRGANIDTASIRTPQVYQSQASGQLAPRDTSVDTFPVESLQRIMNMASNIAGKITERSNEEEYLRGANAAATGQSVEDLDSNWLTKSIRTAGFTDQTKRMEMAAASSQISAKMPQYAAMDPQQFLDVVNTASQNLFSNTDGMTLKGRQQLLENQLTFSNTLIKTQAAEHGKYNIQQRAAMYNAQGNTLATLVAQAKASGDDSAYANGIAATMAWTKSILTDETLPQDVRHTQVSSMMGLMLSQDSRTAVEAVINSGLVNSLPSAQLSALQGQVRESRNRTQLADNQGLYDQYSMLMARQATQGDVPVEDFNRVLSQMAARQLVSGQGYMSAQEEFLKQYAKQAKSAELANAYAQGDQTGMLRLNASPEDAADAFVKARMRMPGATSASVAQDLLNVGMSTGFPSAYKRAAALIEPGLTNFGTEGQMNPDAAQSVTSMLDRVTVAEQHGDTTAFSKLLSGLSPENQEKLVFMREQIKSGQSVNQAGMEYIKAQNDTAGLTPSQKQQLLAQRQTAVNRAVSSVEAQGLFSRAWMGLAGVFSDNARNQFQTRVASGDITAAQELGEVSAAYREELQSVILRNPNVTDESMQQLAQARLAARVLRVGETALSAGAVLVAPRGQTVQSMLGLPANVAPDRIGRAIAAINQTQTPEGYEAAYSFMPDGGLSIHYMDKQGNVAPNTTALPAAAIQQRIKEDDQVAATVNNEVYGTGKLFIDPASKVGVRVNGVNTAGIDEAQMLQARGALIDFEGVRNQVYRDTNGIATNGVGISSRSGEFAGRGSIAGTWSPKDIHESFVNHTNMVARSTGQTSAALGWSTSNNAQFQFLMQIGYQGGADWYKSGGAYGRLADAIRMGNTADALTALRMSPVYRASSAERQRFYESSLTSGMAE